jgi:flagellar motor protein MotB
MKRLSRLRKRHMRSADEGSWAVSYGDMITLLLGFYIMYFSIDPPKKGNESLTTSLITALEKLDKDVALDKKSKKAAAEQTKELAPAMAQKGEAPARASEVGNAPVEQVKTVDKNEQKTGQEKKMATDSATAMQTIMEILLPEDWVEKLSEHRMSAKSVGGETKDANAHTAQTKALESSKDGTPTGSSATQPKSSGYRLDVTEIRALDAEASRIGDRVYIMFPRVSFFASASTEITPEGRRALEKFSKVYLPFSGKSLLNIVGFSDERPVKAVYRFRDNLELSVLRAVSAQRVAESVGIPLNRTRLMGHGINIQLVEGEEPSSTVERWALTRKIMLVIEPEVP